MDIQNKNRALRAKTFAKLSNALEGWSVLLDINKHLNILNEYGMSLSCLHDYNTVKAGQEILLCGYIGIAGTAFLAKYEEEQLSERFPRWFIEEGKKLEEMSGTYPSFEQLKELGAVFASPVGEGGVMKELFMLGSGSGRGFVADYEAIPINQVTIELCEFNDLNPYQLFSCGCTLIVTECGRETVNALSALNIPCSIIGYTTKERAMCLNYRGEISLVNPVKQDELMKVLKEKL